MISFDIVTGKARRTYYLRRSEDVHRPIDRIIVIGKQGISRYRKTGFDIPDQYTWNDLSSCFEKEAEVNPIPIASPRLTSVSESAGNHKRKRQSFPGKLVRKTQITFRGRCSCVVHPIIIGQGFSLQPGNLVPVMRSCSVDDNLLCTVFPLKNDKTFGGISCWFICELYIDRISLDIAGIDTK